MNLAKILLFPFSWLYGGITWLRNKLFDAKVMPSTKFDFPVVSIGNLTMGGTGKTPHIEYLINLLKADYKLGTVSRGYGRRTRGYKLVEVTNTSLEVGDEPLQIKKKFPDVNVCVGERRALAIPELLADKPETEVILLDDAFQHRAVQAGFNILLTDFNQLFIYDYVVPAGSLREFRPGYKRAEIIVVTKCPPHLPEKSRQKIETNIRPREGQKVVFSYVGYGDIVSVNDKSVLPDSQCLNTDIILVTGIAKPLPLLERCEHLFNSVKHLKYGDHHSYTKQDIENIKAEYNNLNSTNKVILTTEKDSVRLADKNLNDIPVYYMPIEVRFFKDDKKVFDEMIVEYIRNEKQKQDD